MLVISVMKIERMQVDKCRRLISKNVSYLNRMITPSWLNAEHCHGIEHGQYSSSGDCRWDALITTVLFPSFHNRALSYEAMMTICRQQCAVASAPCISLYTIHYTYSYFYWNLCRKSCYCTKQLSQCLKGTTPAHHRLLSATPRLGQ